MVAHLRPTYLMYEKWLKNGNVRKISQQQQQLRWLFDLSSYRRLITFLGMYFPPCCAVSYNSVSSTMPDREMEVVHPQTLPWTCFQWAQFSRTFPPIRHQCSCLWASKLLERRGFRPNPRQGCHCRSPGKSNRSRSGWTGRCGSHRCGSLIERKDNQQLKCVRKRALEPLSIRMDCSKIKFFRDK